MRAFVRDTLTTLIMAAVIVFGLQAMVQSFVVDGPSMNPNFQNGQRLLVSKVAYDFRVGNKIIYHFHEPRRGDVIVFHPPSNQQDDYIKRIIGLPGESVEIKEGTVYIYKEDGNVLLLDEPYITEAARLTFKRDTIPKNEYFVLGDNRNNSSDSRNGWTLPRQNIIGKAWLSIWPPEKLGLASNYTFQEQEDKGE